MDFLQVNGIPRFPLYQHNSNLASINGFSIQIGGTIDLGTHWNSKEFLRTYSERDVDRKHDAEVLTRISDNYETPKSKTKLYNTAKKLWKHKRNREHYKTYTQPISIKDDKRINDFSQHIYEQTLKVFDALHKKTSNELVKVKVKSLKKTFKNEFNEFLRETLDQKIRTNIGIKKVMLNIVDTSFSMLKRLINHLILDVDSQVPREELRSSDSIMREIELGKRLEYAHVCKKFNICRSTTGLSNFVVEFINVILNSEPDKIAEAAKEFAEVLKHSESVYGEPIETFLDNESVADYYEKLELLQKNDAETIRLMLQLLRNLILNKNQPYMMINKAALNRTIAFVELIDIIDQNSPPTKENVAKWTKMQEKFNDWSEKKYGDTSELMKEFLKMMFSEIIISPDIEMKITVLEIIKTITHNDETVDEKVKSEEINLSKSNLLYEY